MSNPTLIADRPRTNPQDMAPSRAARVRRTVGAACLPATFALMIVGTAVLDPLDDSANESDTLHQAVGHAGQIAVLGWAEVLSAVLILGGLLTLVGAVRSRGAGWANATGVFAALSAVGTVGVAVNHFVVSGLTSSGLTPGQRVEALTRFHHAGGPIIVLLIVGILSFPLAAVTAWRAGLSSRMVLVCAAAFLVASFAPGVAAEYVAYTAGLVMAAWIARDLLRA